MAATSTQLACPHCGSTLSFGNEIMAGTPVECLICMQSFAADPLPASAPMPEVELPAPKFKAPVEPAPKAQPTPAHVPVGKPAGTDIAPRPKTPIPVAAKANPDAEIFAPPPVRLPPRSDRGGKFAMLAIALGLAFLLTGGIVLAIVKITNSSRGGPEKTDTQVAQNKDKSDLDGAIPNSDKTEEPGGAAQDGKGSTNAAVSKEMEEQIRVKIQEEAKQTLKRKISKTGDAEFNWQPVAAAGGEPGAPDNPKQEGLSLTQKKINAAIDKGLVFLRQSQQPNGTWNNGHAVGHAAIGGLTLLECKAATNDAAVQRAAFFVRSNVGNLSATYELSLAILFLDRLGEQRDRPLIQGMAMRLLAGQNDCGGWSYQCPLMTPQEMLQLYTFLQSNKKPNLLNPIQANAPAPAQNTPLQMNNPFQQFPAAAQGPVNPKNMGRMPAKMAPMAPNMLQQNLQNLAVVRNQAFQKGQMQLRNGAGDNSNTQFALLALWTARRHDVPTDPALLAAFQRFTASQSNDGGWGYTPRAGSSNTMTAVGLLGLAMGHGVSPEIVRFNPKDPKDIVVKPALDDPKIQSGLQALARNIGDPRPEKNLNFGIENLYFLWSVERVAMLYDLRTIGGKDWYGWGAQILVNTQQPNGAWAASTYHGQNPPLNTCFALLFLKRSNLVQDLTNGLRLYTGIRD